MFLFSAWSIRTNLATHVPAFLLWNSKVSIVTQATFLSALTESSIVQALKQPYLDLTESLSKSVSSIANASYTAGIEKLPSWAAKVLLKATEEENEVPDYLVSPPKVHKGPNVLKVDSNPDDAKKPIDVKASSRIFWYVQLTVGIPIFLVAGKYTMNFRHCSMSRSLGACFCGA